MTTYNEQEVMSMMRMAAELTDAEINKYRDSYLALIKEKDSYIKELELQLEDARALVTSLRREIGELKEVLSQIAMMSGEADDDAIQSIALTTLEKK